MARAMKDSGIPWIGEIPEDWQSTKIKYYYDCYDGKRVPVDAAERKSGPYPYWGAGSITDYVDSYLFDEELVLLGEDGAPFFDSTRPVAFLINEKIWVNNHIHVLKPKMTVNSRFLVHWLNNVDYKSYINGSILNKLTQSNMNAIAFAAPSLQEQERIADYLDDECARIDAVMEQTRASIEEYKKLKQSIITEAVTKGISPNRPMKDSGIEWIGQIPNNWNIEKGKRIFQKLERPVLDDDGVITCFRDGEVTLRSKRREEGFTFSLQEIGYQGIEVGDLVVHGMDGFAGAIGVSDSRGKGTPVLNVLDSQQDKRYMMYYLRSMAFNGVFIALATGIRVRTCDTNWNKLKELPYPLPSIEEQNEIAEHIDKKNAEIDALISKKEKFLAEIESYKKSMIFEYVTGKKEVV